MKIITTQKIIINREEQELFAQIVELVHEAFRNTSVNLIKYNLNDTLAKMIIELADEGCCNTDDYFTEKETSRF